jgi:hypothetical protein
MMSIKFQRFRKIKTAVDYSKHYSIYETVQLIYQLHNRALSYGIKYRLGYQVFEGSEPIYRDEIQIGQTESINFFEDTLNRVNSLFSEDNSDEKDLLLSKINQMEKEYLQDLNDLSKTAKKENIGEKIRIHQSHTEASSSLNDTFLTKDFGNRLESSL